MNVLAVGAHFDDVELGCSGTLINHAQNGDQVFVLVISSSGYANPNGELIRTDEIALQEGKEAARLMGAELLVFNDPTFYVMFDEKTTKKITELIEKYNIDIVYCPWVDDIHRDHQNAGRSAIMASRHVQRVLMYRPNYYDSHSNFSGKFYSDISAVFEKKIEVIRAHTSELERVRYNWLDFFTFQNANDGKRIGVEYAETFEIVRYLG